MKQILILALWIGMACSLQAENNDTVAIRLFKEAGDCYKGTNGAFLNKEKAFELYRQAAERNYIPAINRMADFYYEGDVVDKDMKSYFEWNLRGAELGDSNAQNRLGVCYYDANGTEEDVAKARFWYEKAAEQGNLYAMNNLRGLFKDAGDISNEIKWTRAGAEGGHVKCQYELGEDYNNGHGVKKDEEQAVYWYQKAAEQNNAEAYNKMGVIYFNVKKDYPTAYKYVMKAYELGEKNAIFNVGYMNEHGMGTEQNYAEAERFYLKAVEEKNANRNSALYRLGMMYYEGNSVVKKDKKRGERLLKEAADNGHEDARKYLEEHKVKWEIMINGESLKK